MPTKKKPAKKPTRRPKQPLYSGLFVDQMLQSGGYWTSGPHIAFWRIASISPDGKKVSAHFIPAKLFGHPTKYSTEYLPDTSLSKSTVYGEVRVERREVGQDLVSVKFQLAKGHVTAHPWNGKPVIQYTYMD